MRYLLYIRDIYYKLIINNFMDNELADVFQCGM